LLHGLHALALALALALLAYLTARTQWPPTR
jgi:hypothetical protein